MAAVNKRVFRRRLQATAEHAANHSIESLR